MRRTLHKLICWFLGHDWSPWEFIPSKDYPYWRYCKRCIEKTEYSKEYHIEEAKR